MAGQWIVSRPNHSPDGNTASIDEDFGDNHVGAVLREVELLRSHRNVVTWWEELMEEAS